jgi:hypothetical protein
VTNTGAMQFEQELSRLSRSSLDIGPDLRYDNGWFAITTFILTAESTQEIRMAPKDKEALDVKAGATKNDADSEKSMGKKSGEGELVTMSEEDKELKERLETCVNTLINKDMETDVTVPIQLKAIDVIVTELRTATSSMTSVPKPLKFLRPHFVELKEMFNSILSDDRNDIIELRARLADVLSVLAMTMGKPEERESLKLKLIGAKDYNTLATRGIESKNAVENLGSWGHEYVRSLAGEIGEEYAARILDGADPEVDEPFADILKMVDEIVPFHVTHNAEAEAVDLLIEVQRLKILLKSDAIDENNYQRICLYLVKTADYMSDPDDLMVSLVPKSSQLSHTIEKLTVLLCLLTACRKCLRLPTKYTDLNQNILTHFEWPFESDEPTRFRVCLRSAPTHSSAGKCVSCLVVTVSTTKSKIAKSTTRRLTC